MDNIILTKEELISTFRDWQVDFRMGLTMSYEDADNMDLDSRSIAAAESFINYLNQVRNA